ncbi:DUF72 domain-containing protein [Pedobacter panaciterrae]
MDFGKVASKDVANIDFTLPNDGNSVAQTLIGSPTNTKLYVGCPSWGRREWLGMLYPPRTKEANFLDEYAKQFNSIELNAVFYSIPPANLIRKWYDQVKQPEFLFFPKMSRPITHIKRLKDVQSPLVLFMESISEFKEHLGPILIQVGDNFPSKSFNDLEVFVNSLPTDQKFFIELRHEDFFTDREEVLHLFKTSNIGWVITDSSGRRDVMHMELTVPEIYIRFIGNGADHRQSDYDRIDSWVERLKQWSAKGLEQVYFIIHQHDGKDTPILADYVIKQFNKHLNAGIPLLKFIN